MTTKKTVTKRKVVSKKDIVNPKKDVLTSTGYKDWREFEVIDFPEMGTQVAKGVKLPENWGKIKVGDTHVDFDKAWDELEVPTLRRIPKSSMPLVDKITWVLTAMNVAILISLVIAHW